MSIRHLQHKRSVSLHIPYTGLKFRAFAFAEPKTMKFTVHAPQSVHIVGMKSIGFLCQPLLQLLGQSGLNSICLGR